MPLTRRLVLIGGLLGLVALCLVPPWHGVLNLAIPGGAQIITPGPHAPLWNPPTQEVVGLNRRFFEVDRSRLLLYALVISIVTAVLILLSSTHSKSKVVVVVEEELTKMLPHLAYEYLAGQLATREVSGTQDALLLECALLHVRNLRAFFFDKPSFQRRQGGADFVAELFFETPQAWYVVKARLPGKLLGDCKRAIDQQLAHLNTNRANQAKTVDLLDALPRLWADIDECWGRFREVLSAEWRADLDAAVATQRQERFSHVT
jgi:hypothetical protein